MLEISIKNDHGQHSAHINLNLGGLQPFRAQLFKFEFQVGGRVNAVTWDNRTLDCIGFPANIFQTTIDALEKSDLLGLRLPKEAIKSDGFETIGIVNLENKPD